MQTKKLIFYSLFLLSVFSFILINKVLACDNCGGRNPGDEWCENGKKYRCVACGPDCRIPGTNTYTCCQHDKPEWDSTCTQGAGKDKFTLEVGSCGGSGGGSERVVGRVTTGNCQFLTGVLITSSDGKVAGWDYNEQPGCGWSPHYQIGRWSPGTQVMITVTPPSGYTCSNWTFDSKPNEPGGEASGQGCVAIITIGQGRYSPDWQNHLWFYLSQCQNECSSAGQVERRCSGNYVQKRTCGNYDNDPCLEWSNWENEQDCGSQGKICQNGQCTTQTCSRDADCPNGYFCEFPAGSCAPPGICVRVPEICMTLYDPVCGCDNRTYSNDCFRMMARISKKHHGECCQNECSLGATEYRCSGNYLQKRTCGNYDSDSCTEWSQWENLENCAARGGYCSFSLQKCVLPPAVITKGVVITY